MSATTIIGQLVQNAVQLGIVSAKVDDNFTVIEYISLVLTIITDIETQLTAKAIEVDKVDLLLQITQNVANTLAQSGKVPANIMTDINLSISSLTLLKALMDLVGQSQLGKAIEAKVEADCHCGCW